MQAYSDPTRERDPHALPDLELFVGYEHECRACGEPATLFPDYYGLLYPGNTPCEACGKVGMRCTDTRPGWFYWYCLPGCLPDSEPFGPFATEAEALADARESAEA